MTKEIKKVADEATKVKAPAKTIAGTFQLLGVKSHNDRKSLAKDIVEHLAKQGVTKNVRGHTIREEKVLQQISAMCADIDKKRGSKTNSWWSKFRVDENDKQFKLTKLA